MTLVELLRNVRAAAGLSQRDLARLAGTSGATIAAYEAGAKEPRIGTWERLVTSAGYQVAVTRTPHWSEVPLGGGRTACVADALPDLPASSSMRSLALPLHLEWSRPGRHVDLMDRQQRARTYEVVLREGSPADIESIVDGALLIDLWDELVLPRTLRAAWQPTLDAVRRTDG